MSAPVVRVAPGDGLDVTAPLLDPEIQASASGASPANGDVWLMTPLPYSQVAVLSFAALSEPICVNFIFPFINEMLSGMSNGPKQLAFRSGIFFGCFSLAQFSCVYFWGTLSDRMGRKPVILICLATGLTSTALFGVSSTFVQALIFRIITGASYGDVPVLRSAMGEVTDSTNQARAFSFLPLTWAIGSSLAPLMGGFLNHPVERFPKRFRNSQFLKDHPYALPCFASSVISLAIFIVVALFLRETSGSRNDISSGEGSQGEGPNKSSSTDSRQRVFNGPASPIAASQPPPTTMTNYGSTRTAGSRGAGVSLLTPASQTDPTVRLTAAPERNAPPRSSAFFRLLADSTVRNVLLSYFCLAFISTANDVILALWMFLDIKNAGLGLTPAQIAISLSGGSILQTLLIVFLFPWLHRRVGTLIIYRSAMAMLVLMTACYPLVHLIAESTTKRHYGNHENDFLSQNQFNYLKKPQKGIVGSWDGVPRGVIAGVSVMMIVKAFGGLTWGCNMILVTSSAPTSRSLGAVNSMAQMAASFGRAVGPPIYSSIFAISMGKGVLGGKGLIWIFMGACASVSLLITFIVREGERDWRRSRRAT